MKRILASLLGLAIIASIAFPAAARAWLLHVDFNVLGAANDPVNAGRTANGFFTFDSSLIPSGGGNVWNVQGHDILGLGATALSFTWDGVEWNTLNADLFVLNFLPDESLSGWGIGGAPFGYNGLSSRQRPDFWVVGWSVSDFTYYSTNLSSSGFAPYQGTVISWSVTTTPEPNGLVLFGPGLIVLGMIRRRRK